MQTTRQQLLEILREDREATVDGLAQQLELTPMTIRHHLNVLQAEGLVVTSQVRRMQKVGRPRLVYTLTDAADELFPQAYGDLASQLVSEMKQTIGREGTQAMFHRIAERIAAAAPPAYEGQRFENRLEQVTEYLNQLGFQFRWEKTDEGVVMANVNCPYRRVAQEHAEVCAMDTVLLQRLLGVTPRHVSRLREGDPSCRCILVPAEG
jgi:predicted ArsR family transcriptional regulator